MQDLSRTPFGDPVDELRRIDKFLAIQSRDEAALARERAEEDEGGTLRIARDQPPVLNFHLASLLRAGWHFVPWAGTDAQLAELRKRENILAAEHVYIGREFRPLIGTRRLWARFRRDASAEQRASAAEGLKELRRLRFVPDLVHFRVPDDQDPRVVAERLRPVCEYVELDYEHVTSPRSPVRDPRLPEQGHWALIRASNAWLNATGSGVRVAVVDNDFAANHADLTAGIDFNSAAVFSSNGSDVVFSVPGSAAAFPSPNSNHGTQCLGLLGARKNFEGGRGLAFESTLVPIVIPDASPQSTLARAIAFAVDPFAEGSAAVPAAAQGVRVISCSLGPDSGDAVRALGSMLNDVLNEAAARGVFISWAVTNCNKPVANDEVCSHAAVDAIGAVTEYGSREGGGFGPPLSCVAPGFDLLTSVIPNGYSFCEGGTSFAAPIVAGLAALLMSCEPGASTDDVRSAIFDGCKLPTSPPDQFGHGHIDAKASLDVLKQRMAPVPSPSL
jgi:subtilisin family serine protease